MIKTITSLLLMMSIALLTACASTQLVTEWHDKTYQGGKINKLLVIGVTKNELYRRSYEDGIVKQLQQAGVNAVASYTLMEDLAKYDEKEKLEQAVNKINADGIIVAKLIDVDKSERYIPPSYDVSPSVGYYGGYYGSYRAAVGVSYQPGYVQKSTTIRIGSEVFSTQSGKLIWAAETESFNPSSYQKVIDELAVITQKGLKENGFIH